MKNQEIRRIKIKNSFIFRLIIPSALYFKKDFFHSKLGLMRTGETGGKIDDEIKQHIVDKDDKAGVEVIVRVDVSNWIDGDKIN